MQAELSHNFEMTLNLTMHTEAMEVSQSKLCPQLRVRYIILIVPITLNNLLPVSLPNAKMAFVLLIATSAVKSSFSASSDLF